MAAICFQVFDVAVDVFKVLRLMLSIVFIALDEFYKFARLCTAAEVGSEVRIVGGELVS